LRGYREPRYLLSFPTRRSSDLGSASNVTGVTISLRLRRDLLPREVTGYTPTQGPQCSKLFSSEPSRSQRSRCLPHLPWPSLKTRSEEHTSELQSRENLVCRLLL